MYNVSNEYKSQIDNQLRNPSYMRVRFGIIDPDAITNSTITNNGETAYSDSDSIKIESDIPVTYDTLELNKFLLDSKHKLATESYGDEQGYVSNSFSDANCDYSTPPKLIVDYTGYFEFTGLTLRFDQTRNDFAQQFRVECYNDAVKVFDSTYVISDYDFTTEDDIPLHNKMEISFLKSALPYKRTRLHYLGFGIVRTLDDAVITDTRQRRKVDLLSTSLPVGDFDFTFIDVNSEYDPDNPTGLYQYLESLQPVKFEYGYELDNGSVEWVLGGNNFTTGEVSINNDGRIGKVTFKTNNALAYLTDVYNKGVYSASGTSLYDLAVAVMDGTGIQYDFDTSLQSLSTSAPVPKLSRRECLQLIANASMSLLDVDRVGKVTIRPLDVSATADDFNYDFNKSLNPPTVSKLPQLKNVNTNFRTYTPSTVLEELTKVSISVTSNTEYFLEYDMATDISAVVDGTLTIVGAPEYYAEGCLVTLNGTGDITVSGKRITVTKTSVSKNFDVNGEDCNVENELITNSTHATSYADWTGNVLVLKNEYTFENRGYPEVDVSDLVSLQTIYNSNLKVVVTENDIRYNGGLSAVTKVVYTNESSV